MKTPNASILICFIYLQGFLIRGCLAKGVEQKFEKCQSENIHPSLCCFVALFILFVENFSPLCGHSVLMYALILIRDITKFWWKNRDTSSLSRHTSSFSSSPCSFQRQNLNLTFFWPRPLFVPPRFPLRHYQIFPLLVIPSFLLSFMIKAISSR